MALTPEELESQIESLNATVAEQKAAAEKIAADAAAKDTKIKELEEAAKKAPGADYEDLKTKVARMGDVEKENVQLKTQIQLKEMQAKYPDVDFSLVPNGTVVEMEATAGKLQASIEAALKKRTPAAPASNGAAKPTDPWSGLPPANGDLEETRRRQDEQNADKVIEDAKRSGNAMGVLNGILAKDPGAKRFFGPPAKK